MAPLQSSRPRRSAPRPAPSTGVASAPGSRRPIDLGIHDTMCDDARQSGFSERDMAWMRRALELAVHARDADGEVLVGAVLVLDGAIVGEGWNRNITLNDPSAHAEIGALRAAGQRLANYRFPGSTLYATLEPCAMCAMALVHARMARVVYGATDPKTGAAGSALGTLVSGRRNHRVEVRGGLLASESAAPLCDFLRSGC